MGFIKSNLKAIIASRNLNVKKVSEITPLSRTTVSNLANNNSDGIHYETLIQLCNLLKCQPGDIFTFYDVDLSIELHDLSGSINVTNLFNQYRNTKKEFQSEENMTFNTIVNINNEGDVFQLKLPTTVNGYFKTSMNFVHTINFSKKINDELKKYKLTYDVEAYAKDQIYDFIIKEISNLVDYDIGYDPFQIEFDCTINN
ncbi:helix-turn-helix domain-containing protein [Virgibacillus sp. DJP39]|uniref:helix-turn-helix domain-containing protein n=1 Tax=Virgibacillus sp. DJP39 TaxID=3409790 RepID=UPI003BB5AFD5